MLLNFLAPLGRPIRLKGTPFASADILSCPNLNNNTKECLHAYCWCWASVTWKVKYFLLLLRLYETCQLIHISRVLLLQSSKYVHFLFFKKPNMFFWQCCTCIMFFFVLSGIHYYLYNRCFLVTFKAFLLQTISIGVYHSHPIIYEERYIFHLGRRLHWRRKAVWGAFCFVYPFSVTNWFFVLMFNVSTYLSLNNVP